MANMGPVVAGAMAEVARRQKQERYKTDPVAWAENYLGIKLWSRQKEIIESIRDNRNTAVAAGHGVGKDLPLDTPLPTPSGWTTMGDVQPGDYLLDEEGNPTLVTTKSVVFNNPLYKITFSDGAEVVSSETHLWNTIDFKAAKKARRSEQGVTDWRDWWDASTTKQTSELLETLTVPNGSAQARNHNIPINRALQLPEIDLPVDPYVLGAWLGDGTSIRAEMTIGDCPFIVDEFEARGVSLTKLPSQKYGYTFAHQGFVKNFKELGVYDSKRIPGLYLRASVDQRKDLLRGLMDTDGFVCHDSVCGIDLMSNDLALGVVELVRSLGARISMTPSRTYLDGRDVGIRYRMVFNPDFDPFTEGSYKSQAFQPHENRTSHHTSRWITSIERVETVPSQCVSVDSPRNLYLATEWMIPTHNTFCAAVAVAWWIDTHPPEETFVASTAPSVDQVALLWDNLRRMHGTSLARYKEGLVDHPLPGYITGDNKWKLADGSLLGQGRKPPDNKSDVAFQGRHATYLFAIGDEAVGLSAGYLEALGNIATAEHNRELLLANPTDPGCAMAKLWDEKITGWNRMHISVFDSPLVTLEEGFDSTIATGMSGWDYINDKKEEWGEDDPRYIARVLGQWAFDAGNTIYTAEELANAKNTVVLPYDYLRPELGWDIARKGADATVGYSCVKGEVWETDPETGKPVKATGRDGWRIRRRAKWYKAPLVGNDPVNKSTAQRIHDIAIGDGTQVLKLDASGIGIAVVDGLVPLNEAGTYTVIEVFGGAAASDKRAYMNMRAEQFFEMKKAMAHMNLDLDPKDEELFDELSGIQFENTDKGPIKVESKETIRKNGRKSPDHADGAWYAFLDVEYLFDPINRMSPGDKVVLDMEQELQSYELDHFYGGANGF